MSFNLLGGLNLQRKHHALFVFLISMICTLTCGSQYSISAWSPHLKTELNATQSDIELVGTISNVVGYFGPVTGVLIFVFNEFWVALVCLMGGVVGLLPMALAIKGVSGFTPARNPGALGFLFGMSGFGSGTLYTLLLTVNMKNWPENRRGTVVACLSTLYGLSASFYTVVYNGPLDSNVGNLILFLMFCTCTAAILTALFARTLDPSIPWSTTSVNDQMNTGLLLDEQDTNTLTVNRSASGRSNHGLTNAKQSSSKSNSFVIHTSSDETNHAIYDADHDDVEREQYLGSTSGSSSHGRPRTSSNAIFGEVASHTVIPSADDDDDDDADGNIQDEDIARGRATEQAQEAVQARIFGGGLAGNVFGALWFLIFQPSFYLLMAVFFLIAGSGLLMINNAGHVVKSLNNGEADNDYTTFLIFALSFANGLGRILMSISDYVPIRKGFFLLFSASLMTLTHFINAFAITTKDGVLFSVIGCGIAYGAMWCIMPVLITDFYGAKNFSMNVGWIGTVGGFGGLLFNTLAGKFYDAQTPAGSNTCIGAKCFRSAFILGAAGAAIAIVLVAFLIPMTRKGRKKLEKRRNRVKASDAFKENERDD